MSTLIVLLLVHCNYVRKFPLCNRDLIFKKSLVIAIYRGNHCSAVKAAATTAALVSFMAAE